MSGEMRTMSHRRMLSEACGYVNLNLCSLCKTKENQYSLLTCQQRPVSETWMHPGSHRHEYIPSEACGYLNDTVTLMGRSYQHWPSSSWLARVMC